MVVYKIYKFSVYPQSRNFGTQKLLSFLFAFLFYTHLTINKVIVVCILPPVLGRFARKKKKLKRVQTDIYWILSYSTIPNTIS